MITFAAIMRSRSDHIIFRIPANSASPDQADVCFFGHFPVQSGNATVRKSICRPDCALLPAIRIHNK